MGCNRAINLCISIYSFTIYNNNNNNNNNNGLLTAYPYTNIQLFQTNKQTNMFQTNMFQQCTMALHLLLTNRFGPAHTSLCFISFCENLPVVYGVHVHVLCRYLICTAPFFAHSTARTNAFNLTLFLVKNILKTVTQTYFKLKLNSTPNLIVILFLESDRFNGVRD